MVAVDTHVDAQALTLPRPNLIRNFWSFLAQKRLTEVFREARELPFDDQARFIFFSDCHRGANGPTDPFAQNEALFLHVMKHYYHKGFTYIEVGDGDELWKNRRFRDVRRAHGRTFDRLHQFHQQNRLHLIVGNHDISGYQRHRAVKDNIPAEEGLILRHTRTGQRIFVVHGHQADFKSDSLYILSRLTIRYVWRYVQLLGLGRNKHQGAPKTLNKIERYIKDWTRINHHMIICGHTHRAASAAYGTPPYFNSGSCVVPNTLTGLEIQGGDIMLVKWTAHPVSGHIRREIIVPARRLSVFR
jgi:UDP-2,3-diacylglucosamine pyrophosphatase LpxH